jgi:hypothetical protein
MHIETYSFYSFYGHTLKVGESWNEIIKQEKEIFKKIHNGSDRVKI